MEQKNERVPKHLNKKLGKFLVDEGIITAPQLSEALEMQKVRGGKLGEILIMEGIVDEDTILSALGRQYNMEYIDLDKYEEIGEAVLSLIPESVVRRRLVMPVIREKNVLTIAISDPLNIFARDDLKLITGYEIKMAICSEQKLRKAIENFYNTPQSKEELIESIIKEEISDIDFTTPKDESLDFVNLENLASKAPVVKIVNIVLESALEKGASDIHLEPFEKRIRVRYRVDGVLIEQPVIPRVIYNGVVSRIKILAALDISERRLPQDGRIKIEVRNKKVELRVSTIPTQFGEKVVIRLLDPSNLNINLSQLGFEEATLNLFEKNIKMPHGIILITGPTGSGKTTTLYSAISILNDVDKNIITLEDPVEFNLDGVNQVQVQSEIGMDFKRGLRSFLRQDPDIILVGETRDTETAEIAINAALTGHLVFSTLHTNNAVGAIVRLMNMGVEPFLIASSLIMVLAQRLVRKICTKCKTSYTLPISVLNENGIYLDKNYVDNGQVKLYRGEGCSVCGDSGFKGRDGIYEIIQVTKDIKELIARGADEYEITEAAKQKGTKFLRELAIGKMLEGMTTLEEVLRVTK
ncbi:GspE/PulE family protein [bacterium]